MRGRAKDNRRKVRTSTPTCNLHRCAACGSANPTGFGDDPPERCASCGTVFEREVVNRAAFRGIMLRPGEDDELEIRRAGDDRWRKLREADQEQVQRKLRERTENAQRGAIPENQQRRRKPRR